MNAMDHPGVRRTRLALQAPVQLVEGERSHATALVDISLSGARVTRPATWRGVDRLPLWLEIMIDEGRPVRIAARVARESDGELALSFEALARGEEALLGELLARRGSPTDGLD